VIKGMETGQIDFQSVLGYYEQIKPLMTLVESHAAFVQGILHREIYPNARIEQRFSLPVILFRILGAGKVNQYTGGLSRVAAAMQNGSLDRLFDRTGG
jgi:hypothetical protein